MTCLGFYSDHQWVGLEILESHLQKGQKGQHSKLSQNYNWTNLFGDPPHGVVELRYEFEGVQGDDPVIMIRCEQQHGRILSSPLRNADIVKRRVPETQIRNHSAPCLQLLCTILLSQHSPVLTYL